MSLKSILLAADKDAYGGKYDDHCLDIYKLYLGTAEAISSRRQSANSFFLALNTAAVGFIELFAEDSRLFWTVPVAGIVLCFIWWRLIRSYRDLNSGKFKVIHEIESLLPLAPFDAEWEALGRGRDPKLYLQFTVVESWVPVVFALLHGALFLTALTGLGPAGAAPS